MTGHDVAPWVAGIGGLCVGILIGMVIDDAWDEIYRHVIADRKTRKTPTMTSRRSPLLLWLLIISLVANAFVGVTLIFARTQAEEAQRTATQTSAQLSAFTGCVADYNQRFSTAYQARLKPSMDAAAALDRLMVTVAKKDAAGFQKALAAYVSLRNKLKAEQAKNPPPEAPSTYCGPAPKSK